MRRYVFMSINHNNASSGNVRGSGTRHPGDAKPFSNGARAPKQPRPPRPPKR